MIAYVYWKGSLGINCIINNVTSISGNQIIGDTTINFGGGSNYVILQNSIDKNIGDVIDISNLTDCRDFFLKGKDFWYLEQINKANTRVGNLETEPPLANQISSANALIDDLSQMMVEMSTVTLA